LNELISTTYPCSPYFFVAESKELPNSKYISDNKK
jgi:hypothetical protein